MEEKQEVENKITIDGQPATMQQLQEQKEKGKHFAEDKNNPGNYRTLQKLRG